MSKTKNTPEFEKMMADQELAASFHYEETETEYDALRTDLAKLQTMQLTRLAFDRATEELTIALDNYSKALSDIKKLYDAE
jgi:hypothetical protein